MKRQFTCACYVFQDERALLIFHRKLKMWLPPGGHIDPNETPPEAAKREVLEETGLEVEILQDENVWISPRFNAQSIPRPFMCLLEEIPAIGDEPAHQHIDQVFVSRVIRGEAVAKEDEVADIRWFNLEEIEDLKGDKEIFKETQETLRILFPWVKERLGAQKLEQVGRP